LVGWFFVVGVFGGWGCCCVVWGGGFFFWGHGGCVWGGVGGGFHEIHEKTGGDLVSHSRNPGDSSRGGLSRQGTGWQSKSLAQNKIKRRASKKRTPGGPERAQLHWLKQKKSGGSAKEACQGEGKITWEGPVEMTKGCGKSVFAAKAKGGGSGEKEGGTTS